MTINKRRKNSRLRGSHTHGWGARRSTEEQDTVEDAGNAGSGKRADAKKPSFWNDTEYFGKHGFKSKGQLVTYERINLRTVEGSLRGFIEKGWAKEEKGAVTVDLRAAGYTKLLSSGKATKKLVITVQMASPEAIAKVKKAGGDVKVEKATREADKKE